MRGWVGKELGDPEDYTARGKIITPLKDRIGAKIRTHHPDDVEIGMDITRQEAWVERGGVEVQVPDFLRETVELIAFLARSDKRIDHRSGVSQRMPITVTETIVSNAERRALRHGEPVAVPRIADLYSALPAITGKIELEYEGELHGHDKIARELIQEATFRCFSARAGGADVEGTVEYFETGGALQVGEDARRRLYPWLRNGPGTVGAGGVGRPRAEERERRCTGRRVRASAGGAGRSEAGVPEQQRRLHPGPSTIFLQGHGFQGFDPTRV